ncbi:complement C3-like protein [Labeo rohita]|uniref:Complement C3-like protein n=1 Tax=Labeo rohita TaxID=84645 RepID=A0A498NZ43_LABRO|nr:complement C3-like protein [Labeo rohita]
MTGVVKTEHCCVNRQRNIFSNNMKGVSRCLVLMTVSLGLICVLLLVFIILQHFTITAERDLIKSYKNTVEEFNQTINSLQNNYTNLTQKKLTLEMRVNNLTAEKSQLQRSFETLNQTKLQLESKVTCLSEKLKQEESKQRNLCGPVCLLLSNNAMSWSDSRQYCRDHGADLVIINSEEKQMYDKTQEQIMDLEAIYDSDEDTTGPRTTSYSQAKGKDQQCRGRCLALITVSLGLICVLLLVFIILQNITITAERDQMKSYKNTVEEFNQTISSLQHNYTDLMTKKDQLQNNFRFLSQKKLELETRVNSLSDELKKKVSNGGNQSSLDGLFISKKPMSWSDSRQYCRDRGADLVIINTEEKQRLLSSSFRERLWIGLSDIENEGNLTWVDNSPLNQGYVLSAPNILKVGAPEKVFVEAQDYSGASLNVKISVRNPKDNNREVTSASVSLTPDKNYQDLVEIEVPGNAFSFEKGVEQYAILQAQFPQNLLEKKVMVIFQSGHIVLQTDKTIYTPDSTVYYRVFSLSSGMTRPVESGVRMEILTPDGISLESKSVYPGGGMVSGTFSLTNPASPGLWKLVAWHKNSPQKNFSSEFEVKEYVLPSFEVSLSPQKAFFYVNDDSLTVDVDAKYLFGETVSGHGFVVFGVVTEDKGKISIPGSLQRVQILDGSGTAELRRKHILQTFPNIMQLVGHSLYVTVSVLTESGSEMVEAHKKGIQIVTSPYTIHFRRTPHYFKPGMPFDISVYVTNPDQTPAKNVEVEVNPGGIRGQTRDNGIAKVTVNTPGGSSTLEITAKTRDPQLSNDQQAVKKMTAQAYIPKGGSNNYLHIGIGAAELQIGDQMKVSLNLGRSPGVRDQDFTYMILSKGQIVQADRFKRRGQSLVSLSLTVTKDMVPSFRFVAYYHVGSSEVVSDSVWVDVKDTCMGTLKVEVHNPVNVYEPGEDFDLRITGDPGAKVGLVAVDKGVYVLNNKNRITQTKIWGVVESHDIGCTAGSGKDSMEVFSDAGLLFESSSAGGTGVRTSSEMVEAHKKGIQIVTSPYTIHFRRTPHYFKPGMPFDISVYVTNPDQTPAKNVEVEVNPGGIRGQTRDNGIAKVTVNTPGGSSTLEIIAKTRDPQLSNDQQAVKKMTAQAYIPKGGSNNYLHIGIGAAELQIGDQMKVSLNLGRSPGVRDQDFTYMILSKGQIVQADRFKRRGQSLVSLSLTVTKDMVPSFRFVAYYHVGSSEVVSDSVWVDVKDTCMGTLKVEVHNPVNVYEPGEDFDLRITGDPGAKVGLVAVDKGVYVLNNKNRITQTKIWGVVESHDIGCTAGSGKDSMEVFSDAGLLFESSSAGGTGVRTISKFSGIGRECCMDGLKKLDDYSCQYRASFIVEGKECIQAFLHCCTEITAHFEDSAEEMILSRSECEDFVNSDDIVTRTLFPESWLWEEVVLPKCSALNRQCQTTTFPRDGLKLKDSITTWEITAISLSSTHGICVADVHEMTVVKNFFIDLKLPYSAVRNEQIEIKAVIHNLYSRRLKVRVELMETKDICSPASKRGKFQTIVTVDAKSSYSVPFVIVPLALGRHAIEVKAAAAGRASDGVRKELLVVSEGVLTKLNENLQFSPSKKGGEHVEVINSLILKDQAPNTPSITYVSAIGDTISITIEKAISGHAMGSLIIQPGGCGEQNMAGLTMPVIATHYLDKTSQWHTLNAGLRETAVTYITRGYNQQLAYRKTDGSYAAYISRPSSTWLTAYVAKVFAMASNIVYIDRNVICSALNWLIQNKQLPDGVFREDAPVLSGGMTGNVHGENTQASMTAFVLIALQEGRGICAGQISSLDSSMYKAIVYLRSQIHSLTNPYAVAMTSYALASGNALDKQVLLRKAYADGSHWPVPGSSTFTLEASAYALLALVKAQDFQSAAPIVNWLNNQRQYSGGYGSTQIPSNRQITISAKGSGEASVTVVTEYYAKPKESKSTCNNFELALAFERNDKVTYQGATESYKLIIKTRYLSADRDATMSILDISLLTGFVVDENDLKALSTGCDRIIQKFEMNKQLSERGSLILYLDKISHTREERISFRLHRIMNGGFLQPAAVTVYEYYSIENRCVKFYHPTRKEGALQKICKNDVCQCAEENCSLQKKEKILEAHRNKKACEPKIDYVYKAVVLRENEDALTVYYDMKIELALKTGPEKNVEGMQRTFSLQISCKEALNLKGGESYLIMGQADDVQMEGRIGQYALGERTWLEFWPSLEESKTSAELKEKYNGMLSLQQDLRFGCG